MLRSNAVADPAILLHSCPSRLSRRSDELGSSVPEGISGRTGDCFNEVSQVRTDRGGGLHKSLSNIDLPCGIKRVRKINPYPRQLRELRLPCEAKPGSPDYQAVLAIYIE